METHLKLRDQQLNLGYIDFYVNRSSAPTKRHTVVERPKIRPHVCCLQENHFRSRDTYRLKVRKWETTFHAKENQRWNNTRIEKMNFKIKTYKIQRRILPNDQVQFSCSVVSDSLWPPRTAAQQTSLSITISQSLLKLMPIESVMSSNYLILCHPLLLLSSIFPSITVFSKESVLHIRWPKYWSFSFSISPSNEYSGLIFFRMNWLDLLVVQRTLKSLLQHHSSKASILRHSAFFILQLWHPYMTTGKTVALTRRTFVGKVMSLLLNMLSRLIINSLPRRKRL